MEGLSTIQGVKTWREILSIVIWISSATAVIAGAILMYLGRVERRILESQRFLSAEYIQQLAAELRPIGPFDIGISCTQNDGEACRYRNDFISAVEHAGWHVTTGMVLYAKPYSGVWILYHEEGGVPEPVLPLKNALEKLGLSPQIASTEDWNPGNVFLHIGEKE